MSSLHTLQDLLAEELKDLYNAEKQLLKALPKMARAASNEELKQGFLDHLEETKGHVERLEQIFEALKMPARGKTCHAMEGLIEEGSEAIEAKAPDAIRDAQLIGSAQRIEHYEIAAYGTACAWAEELGLADVATQLRETLEEESAADKKLTSLAEGRINAAATSGAEVAN